MNANEIVIELDRELGYPDSFSLELSVALAALPLPLLKELLRHTLETKRDW